MTTAEGSRWSFNPSPPRPPQTPPGHPGGVTDISAGWWHFIVPGPTSTTRTQTPAIRAAAAAPGGPAVTVSDLRGGPGGPRTAALLPVSPSGRCSAVHLLSSSRSLAAITAAHARAVKPRFCQTLDVSACSCGAARRGAGASDLTSLPAKTFKIRDKLTVERQRSSSLVL